MASKQSPTQVLQDAFIEETEELQTKSVGGTPGEGGSRLSTAQILQAVHDPSSSALRVSNT